MIKKQKYIMDFVTGICVPEIEMNLGEVNFEMDMVQVAGGVRALRATWTPELAQDVQAYHNIDAEAELTAMLGDAVAREIDREILENIQAMTPIGHPLPIDEPYIDPILPPHEGIMTVGEVTERNEQLRRQQEIREETISKWDGLGFLDGLQGHVRENVNTLLENQATTLINEEPLTLNPPQQIDEQIQFPIVRQVFSHLMANDIVSHMPIGNIRENVMTPNLDYVPTNDVDHMVNWRSEDTWELDGLYGSLIGVSMDMKPLNFLPKKNPSLFDSVTLPTVRRMFV
jgi:hypothetical protein